MSNPKPKPERWHLTFVPAPGDYPPMSARIKRLLKAALRSYGLRCVDLRPLAIEGNHIINNKKAADENQ